MAKNKKEKSTNKSSNTLAAKKFEAEKPEVAKRHNIRVSNPYGYYPEDVDKIILSLESQISNLQKENTRLEEARNDLEKRFNNINDQYQAFKAQVILMEGSTDTSAEEDFANLSRIGDITGKPQPQVMNKKISKLTMPLSVVDEPHEEKTIKISHKDLVRPKKSN